jgi:hypothetical protein
MDKEVVLRDTVKCLVRNWPDLLDYPSDGFNVFRTIPCLRFMIV